MEMFPVVRGQHQCQGLNRSQHEVFQLRHVLFFRLQQHFERLTKRIRLFIQAHERKLGANVRPARVVACKTTIRMPSDTVNRQMEHPFLLRGNRAS